MNDTTIDRDALRPHDHAVVSLRSELSYGEGKHGSAPRYRALVKRKARRAERAHARAEIRRHY